MKNNNKFANRLDAVSVATGRIAAWLTFLMVLVTVVIVVLRYIFDLGFIWLQESLIGLHAAVFMLGAAYTLQQDEHVRVDIFYRGASRRYKARVDFWGTAVFLIPVLALLWVYGLPYVVNSWAELEGSIETGGLPAVFLLKTLILFAAATLSLQAVALLLRSWLTLREAS